MKTGMGGRAPLFSDPEIIRAAIKIRADGGEVTPYTLVGKLGGGSIGYMRKAIKRLVSDKQIQVGAAIGEYDEIIETITTALENHKNNAKLSALKEYTADRARIESANSGLRGELAEEKRKTANLEKDLARLNIELANTKGQLTAANEQASRLRIEAAARDEKLAAIQVALDKAEKQSDEHLDRLHTAHNQFQGERRELLDRLNDLSISARQSQEAAHRSEQSMRSQLEQALKNGLEHTKTISKLRDEIRPLVGGKELLKKFKSWENISSLCKANHVTGKKH